MTDEQTAAAIVADSRNACDETAMEAAIVRALQAARTPPPGHIIDDAGVVRKVLGTLPVSIDGMVIGTDARVYWTNGAGYIHDIITQDMLACVNGFRLPPSGLHGSREAAEAAKEGKA